MNYSAVGYCGGEAWPGAKGQGMLFGRGDFRGDVKDEQDLARGKEVITVTN